MTVLILAMLATPFRLVVGVEAEDLWRSYDADRIDAIVGSVNGAEVRRLRRAVVIDAEAADRDTLVTRLAARDDVRWIEEEVFFPVRLRAPPDDPRYPEQWTLHPVADPEVASDVQIEAEAAWAITTGRLPGGDPVRVAVVDDGFDLSHPDLRFTAGYDVASNDGPSGYDDDPTWEPGDFHGTQTAGVAGALGNNATGIAGVCPDCDIVPVRLIGGGGPADLFSSGSAVAAAIEWAALVGEAAVINNSWGPPDGNPFDPSHPMRLWPQATTDHAGGELPLVLLEALYGAVTEGRDGRGCVITWSAGNGNELVTYDGFANNPLVLAIGSVDATGRRSYYSDFGPPIFLVAPSSGGFGTPGVLTTDISGTAGESADDYDDGFGGTSASAAMVAGVAALVIAAYPDLWAAQVVEALALSAHRIDDHCGEYSSGRSPQYGFGRVDAGAALEQAALYDDDCTFGFELCANQRDDDCDGTVDDPQECATCLPDGNGGEICDGADNDCDGRVDEDFACTTIERPVCAPCGDSSECAMGMRCRSSVAYPGAFCFVDCTAGGADECAPGFGCNGEVCLLIPETSCGLRDCRDYLACGMPETCDGIDNDCNGTIDDLDPAGDDAQQARVTCDGHGVCAGRSAVCTGGRWRCEVPPGYAANEICNDGLDNDCDGAIDGGCPPPARGCSGGATEGGATLLVPALLWRRRRMARR